jgi:uncharacterized membrane protein HdeD (DUF308 family)
MSMNQPDSRKFNAAVANALHQHWVLFLVEGVVLLVLGATAIFIPPFATLAITIIFGWVFLVSGVVGLITTFYMRHAPGFWWSLLSAAIGILVGGMLLARPITGALSLTLVLIGFFVIEGIVTIMFALEHKRELSGQWGWMLASGVVDLLLSAMIFTGLPSSAAWAIGLLVGINMIFGGTALIAMALHARDAAPSAR